MAALRAARDFGLDPDVADSIAARFDPRRHDLERIIDALAIALLVEGAVEVPDTVWARNGRGRGPGERIL